jgi:hypothetical protein
VAPAIKTKAKKLFRRGNRLVKRKKYDAALKTFRKAYALWKHPSILYNMASALALKGETIAAAERLRTFLKQRDFPKRKLPNLLQNVLRKTGILIIEIPDPKATIHIDGRQVGRGKVRVTVRAGERVIDIRRGDRVVAHKKIRVPGDREKVWELAQMPKASLPPRARPEAGASRPAPRKGPDTPTAAVTPQVKKSRGLGRLHWAYFASTAGLAVASLAGAVTASVLTKQAKEDNRQNPTPDTKDRGETRQLAANIMWGVTAAVAAGAAVMAVFTRWKDREQATADRTPPKEPIAGVRATVFPGGAQLTVDW